MFEASPIRAVGSRHPRGAYGLGETIVTCEYALEYLGIEAVEMRFQQMLEEEKAKKQ